MKRKWIIFAIVICILFIWFQSAVSESRSASESDWFTKKIITPLIQKMGYEKANRDVVRKVAHVVEFTLLSVFASLYWKGKVVPSLYTGFSVAFLDESLQVITGRGALITDIWIDLAGVAIGTAIGTGLWKLKKLKDYSKNK